MESSSSNLYRLFTLAVSFCFLYGILVLYGDFGREKVIATRFYTVREVDQILQEKIEEERENLMEEIGEIKKENLDFSENDTDKATVKERRKVVLVRKSV
jgi:hypothetical protein